MILCAILRKACSRAEALSFYSEVNSSRPALSSFPVFAPACTPHDKRKGPHFHCVFAEARLHSSYRQVKGENSKFAKFKMTLPHRTSSSLSLHLGRCEEERVCSRELEQGGPRSTALGPSKAQSCNSLTLAGGLPMTRKMATATENSIWVTDLSADKHAHSLLLLLK